MPYKTRDDLPENVQNPLSEVPHAQDIFKEAYNNAWEQYSDPKNRRGDTSREEAAQRVAWGAVKQLYQKGVDGKWHKKE